MPTLYLHIGRGQTGTTTIQRYLSRNRARLRECAIHYVAAGDANRGGHQNFAKSFISNPPIYMDRVPNPEGIRDRVLREIKRSPARSILISSENFALANVSAVRDFFDVLLKTHEIRIILFVRSQDELAESEYNQLVRRKTETRRFVEYVESAFGDYDFMKLVGEWARCFGRENVVCRIYDGGQRDVIEKFLSCLPIKEPFIGTKIAHDSTRDVLNSSLGFKALTLARLLNEIDLPCRDWLYRRLFARIAANDLPALLFGSKEAGAFRARFADSNRAFTEYLLGEAKLDLGGRRYTDLQRDEIRSKIERLRID